jgi:uncharacterized cupin superfamily protein
MKVVHSATQPWEPSLRQGQFEQERKPLTQGLFGAGLWRLPPGKRSFPMHRHLVTEEALYVVSGNAKVRTPEGETAIGPGDWVSFPAGDVAHQLVNDGAEPLVYLAFSVSKGVDVVEYPESNKVASSVGTFPNAKRFIFDGATQVGYFDGEPHAK